MAAAAGLLAVWSTIRLLMVRGCESITRPLVCWYEVPASAVRKFGSVRRGNTLSEAPNSD
jgi:hypothetical protein